MFCVIKYVDYELYQNKDLQEECHLSSPDSENKTLLVNPDCPIGILRDYISTKLRISGECTDGFELCTENGILLDTREWPKYKVDLEKLKDKETYYVVLINDEEREIPKLLNPLLNQFSREYIEFMSQTRPKRKSSISSNRSRRRSSSKTSNSLSSHVGSSSTCPDEVKE